MLVGGSVIALSAGFAVDVVVVEVVVGVETGTMTVMDFDFDFDSERATTAAVSVLIAEDVNEIERDDDSTIVRVFVLVPDVKAVWVGDGLLVCVVVDVRTLNVPEVACVSVDVMV